VEKGDIIIYTGDPAVDRFTVGKHYRVYEIDKVMCHVKVLNDLGGFWWWYMSDFKPLVKKTFGYKRISRRKHG